MKADSCRQLPICCGSAPRSLSLRYCHEVTFGAEDERSLDDRGRGHTGLLEVASPEESEARARRDDRNLAARARGVDLAVYLNERGSVASGQSFLPVQVAGDQVKAAQDATFRESEEEAIIRHR